MGDTLKELENSPALKKWLLENVEKMITYHSEQLSQWEKLLQQINNLPSVNKSEKKPTKKKSLKINPKKNLQPKKKSLKINPKKNLQLKKSLKINPKKNFEKKPPKKKKKKKKKS